MKTAFILDAKDIRLQLRYDLVYETVSRSVYNTGSCKRKLKKLFTEEEEHIINTKIIPKAKKWATKGVPDNITITTREFNVWKAFERFCAIL